MRLWILGGGGSGDGVSCLLGSPRLSDLSTPLRAFSSSHYACKLEILPCIELALQIPEREGGAFYGDMVPSSPALLPKVIRSSGRVELKAVVFPLQPGIPANQPRAQAETAGTTPHPGSQIAEWGLCLLGQRYSGIFREASPGYCSQALRTGC